VSGPPKRDFVGLEGGGRNGIGRREKWPKKVGRREKLGQKCREEGENEMLGVGRDGLGGGGFYGYFF